MITSKPVVEVSPSERQAIIELKDFYFRYQKSGPFSLKNVNIEIFEGEVILIGGCSGSGKSTLCHALSGLIPFRITGEMAGSIRLFQKEIWNYVPEEFTPYFGYIFQNAEEQLVNFTVYDEIAFAGENMCLTPDEIRFRVSDIAEKLNITDLLPKSIHALSGGEKQKVILAANLILRPKILIFDEPLAFLDITAEAQFLQLISTIKKEDPLITIIIVEHRLEPFRNFLNRILLIDEKGSIPFFGTINEYQEFQTQNQTVYLRDEILYSSFDAFLTESQNNHIKNNVIQPTSQSIENRNVTNTESIIELHNVSFHYPESPYIFQNYNLSIPKGEFIGIVGENGVGKTSLLYLLSKILLPTSGQIFFKGKLLEDYPTGDFFHQIGFIFQNPENQIFESSIHDEILFGPRNFDHKIKQLTNQEQKSIVDQYLPFIADYRQSNEELGKRNPFRLSWGQKRRLNLCSIFSYNPELLLIDEPFIGQDAQSVTRIFDLLHDFHKKGKTIILVSHDLELIQKHCTQTIFLNNDQQSNSPTISPEPKQIYLPDQDPLKNISEESKKNEQKKSKKKPKVSKKVSRTDRFISRSLNLKITPSWLSTYHPTVKLCGLLALTIILFFQPSIIALSLIFIGVLIVASSAKLDTKDFLRQIRLIVILSLIYVPLNVLFDATPRPGEEVIFYLFNPPIPIRRLALYYALRTGIIITILFSTATIYNSTTTLKDLVYGAIEFKIPYRFAFAFMIGLRYIPLIRNEITTIEYAQRLRGFGIKKGSNIKKIYQNIVQRITILLIAIFRKSSTTALALEIRGFGVYKTRTNLHHIGIQKRDYLALIAIFAILVIFSLIRLNLFPGIPFPSLFGTYRSLLTI